MSIDKERLNHAQWVFDKVLGWVAAAEVKVAAICAIDTAMLAGLASLFLGDEKRTAWANLFGGASLLSLFFAIGSAALVLIPRLNGGPSHSLLYFGKIAGLSLEEYADKFRTATEEELLQDWTAQIHYNARIAQKKHYWTLQCLYWSLFGALAGVCSTFAALSSG